MLELGKIIICRDGKRFMVVSFPNGEKGLLNLDNYQVRKVEDITNYVSQFHFGVLAISDSLILSR